MHFKLHNYFQTFGHLKQNDLRFNKNQRNVDNNMNWLLYINICINMKSIFQLASHFLADSHLAGNEQQQQQLWIDVMCMAANDTPYTFTAYERQMIIKAAECAFKGCCFSLYLPTLVALIHNDNSFVPEAKFSLLNVLAVILPAAGFTSTKAKGKPWDREQTPVSCPGLCVQIYIF